MQKLDPELARLVAEPRDAGAGAAPAIEVLVALTANSEESDISRLKTLGLSVRSRVGDILTGAVAVDRLEALADDPTVVAIEGGRPLEPE